MQKTRIYELAKELGIPSKELVEFLDDLGADVKNHMSTIDDEIVDLIKEHFDVADEEEGAKERSEKRKPGKTTKGNNQQPTEQTKRKTEPVESIVLPKTITVRELADKLSMRPAELIKRLMELGVMAGINQVIDQEAAKEVATRAGFAVKQQEVEATVDFGNLQIEAHRLEPRPPVVTILGHVDHGKTTLLDAIRETKVAEGEAGGITQHIGAYQVDLLGKKITFLDTPGHAAFAEMRARGAQVTDVVILVVAADDGIMPQTVEAINHAKAANVPIIVAINKSDKPTANPDRVKQQLSEHGLVPDDWGGDTVTVSVSALQKEGLDSLLEMVLLVAEMEDLRADAKRPALGSVVEAELDKGRGPVATVLIRQGTLRLGDYVVAGTATGKVRALLDHRGKNLSSAGPSTPVLVLGLSEVPEAGDVFEAVSSSRKARDIANGRLQEKQTEDWRSSRLTLTDLYSRVKQGEVKELRLIVKADVQGSVEALCNSLQKLATDEVRVGVLHSGTGAISETDVNLADASDGIIIGFNVRPDAAARRSAEQKGIDIRLHRVIYEALDEIKAAMEGLLDPEYKEAELGHAEVRDTFKVPKAGMIAGCYVKDGKITRNAKARVLRDNVVIYDGQIVSLRRFKDDVREVNAGYECGVGLDNFHDVKQGDIIEVYVLEAIKRTLD
ncbi:MAG: translation initiation factor IF-2 [Limnochordia bacterium]|nr:translation initiation factor IF-2 [Limnochordia bacterium]